MKTHVLILKWATDYLVSNGYSIENSPEIFLSTPWSTVIRFSTSTGNFYLKETAPAISLEPQIFRLLAGQFHASVPDVIAISKNLHCFLTKDAGNTLRKTLKSEFKPDLLCQAIKQFSGIQRSIENHIDTFLNLGVPDWRLDRLPILYDQMINHTDFLKAEGINTKELQLLQDLRPKFLSQCTLLSNYRIPETLGQHDFHDNNILIDPNTNKMTFIDLGETAIIYPFFSLYTCLRQSIKHHNVKENDPVYQKLEDACFENWLELVTRKELIELFTLIKQLWPIYSALDCYRLMMCVDLQSYKSFYANRPSQLLAYLKEYMAYI